MPEVFEEDARLGNKVTAGLSQKDTDPPAIRKGQSAPREPFSIPKSRLATCGWLTYGKPCKALYTQKVDFAQVKTELQLMEKNDLEVLRAENDRLMVELEKLKAEKKSHGRRRVYN
jgi:hypothetical protein